MKHKKNDYFSRAKRWATAHQLVWWVLGAWWFWGAWFYIHAIQWRTDGWYLGHGNVWSDWSLHLSQVTRFATTPIDQWWVSTYFSGAKFTYPFLSNLLSALMIRVGASYQVAMILPSLVFWTATLLVLAWFGSWVLKSSRQAVLALSVFFLSAGFGLLRVFETESWWRELISPTQDYTQFLQYQWGTGNLFLGMFLPQRAFLMGFWIALLAWGLWLRALEQAKFDRAAWRLAVAAGLLAGCLPIIHMHSFLAVVFLSAPLALRFCTVKWRQIAWFMGSAAVVSLPLYFTFVAGGIQSEDFFQLQLGWTALGPIDWLAQWLWQWGAMLPLAAYSLWISRSRLDHLRWWTLASFWGVFLVANVIQFQPVAWDNTKLFLWVYWGLSLSAAWVLHQLWQQGRSAQLVAISIFVALTLTGSVELVRSSQLDQFTYLATSSEAHQLALDIRQRTESNDIFATAPVHNHWVTMWAARPIVMGYSTWVWNFGYVLEPRQTDLQLIFQDPGQRDALLRKYDVSFVVVGPDEYTHYGVTPADFTQYPVFAQTSHWSVFDVRGDSLQRSEDNGIETLRSDQ